jgi:transposase InsO family protein
VAVSLFTDRFTKQAYFCPAKFKGLTARVAADLFVQHVFRAQGVPRVLLSDRASKSTSLFWERLFELLGTKLLFSASYHHQSNGQVEPLHQTLTNCLRSYFSRSSSAVSSYAGRSAKPFHNVLIFFCQFTTVKRLAFGLLYHRCTLLRDEANGSCRARRFCI